MRTRNHTWKNLALGIILSLLSSPALLAQYEVRYGLLQDETDPLTVVGVAYPNFTINPVTISTALFTFTLPAGTATLPAIPALPGAGMFINHTGVWNVQVLRSSDLQLIGSNGGILEGKDVYQVVLTNSPTSFTITDQPLKLFSFRLPNDLPAGAGVAVLQNNSQLQQAVLTEIGANLNNQMSISVGFNPSVDLYAGNMQGAAQLTGPLQPAPVNDTFTISGIVSYGYAAAHYPLQGIRLNLMTLQGDLVDSALTGQDGSYTLRGAQAGQYRIKASTADPGGGYNAVDALLAARTFAGTYSMNALQQLAGDVNLIGNVNSTDALMIAGRFVQQVQAFPAGEWVFDQPLVSITETGITVTQDLQGLCVGDINASRQLVAKSGGLPFSRHGSARYGEGQIISLPVYLNRDAMLGAYSLLIELPSQSIVHGVDVPRDLPGDFRYNFRDNRVLLSWFNVDPYIFSGDEALFHLLLSRPSKEMDPHEFLLMELSEFADEDGMVMQGLHLRIPAISALLVDGFSIDPSPNPASDEVRWKLSIPAAGKLSGELFDLSGKKVMTLADAIETSLGEQVVSSRLSHLPPSVYTYRFSLTMDAVRAVSTGRLVVVR